MIQYSTHISGPRHPSWNWQGGVHSRKLHWGTEGHCSRNLWGSNTLWETVKGKILEAQHEVLII